MIVNKIALVDVYNSYGRCLLDDTFFDHLYYTFLASNDEIPRRFAKTEISKQKEVIRHSLGTVLNYAKEDDAMAAQVIARLKDSHGPGKLNIEPKLYAFWIDSLIKTVKKCDPDFTPELGESWKHVVMPAVTEMISAYDD